jgi:hypothetical protein
MPPICSVSVTRSAGCMPTICSVPATPPASCMPSICATLPQSQRQLTDIRNQRDSRHTSRFPSRPTNPSRRRSPSPRHRRSASPDRGPRRPRQTFEPNRQPGFQSGTGGNVLPACTICLGRHSHRVIECDSTTTWDGQHQSIAKCVHGELLLRQDNQPLCADWQHKRSCSSRQHDKRHIFSGCGQASHGAQTCPRAQKT